MNWFLRLAGNILLLTGVGKTFATVGTVRILDLADPLIGIPFRQLLLMVGLAELLIAFFCLFTDKEQFSMPAVDDRLGASLCQHGESGRDAPSVGPDSGQHYGGRAGVFARWRLRSATVAVVRSTKDSRYSQTRGRTS